MNEKEIQLNNTIFEQFARIGKAISSPKRIELLEILSQGERTVEVLAREANMTVANTSRHLQVLKESRLVETEKEGLYVKYRLASPKVAQFIRAIHSVAENRLAELDWIMKQYLDGKKDLEPVDRDELLRRAESGAVTVVDVRPEEEYRAGHIPGAVSIPLRDLEARISEIPRDTEIVAYCRGPYCVMAIRAVELLRKKGYRASHLEEGIPEWRALGLPIEKDPEGIND
jgi:rhodanese-related sulfurtransferase/predicted transcriptional regulator